MYRGSPKDVTTFGVGATFLTVESADQDVIYQIVKSVFDNLEVLRGLHPAFAQFEKQRMVSEGLSVPLHPGAQKYFEEVGLR